MNTIAKTTTPTPISDYLRTKNYAYMIYTNTDRAIPIVRSGIKPGAQRLLYSMLQDGVLPGTTPRKSAKLTSAATGAYHPHGQSSMYENMVTLAAPYSRLRLIDGIGSFGAFPGDEPAADRYTEARLTPAGYELVKEIKDGAVPMRPTYDNEREEPWYLPARYPVLLIRGAMGIGEGWATKTPAHNPREVLQATKHILHHPDATTEDILKIMPGPDWGTGGTIIGDLKGITDYYNTGKGRITVRCKYHIDGKKITITEVPPGLDVNTLLNGTKKENSKPGLKDMSRQNIIQGISDVSDLSDFEGMAIEIDVKRGHDPQAVMADVLRETDLETTYAASVVALDTNLTPRWWTVRELIDDFLTLRDEVIVSKSETELKKLAEKLKKQRAIAAVALDKDMVAKIILDADNKPTAAHHLHLHKFRYPNDKAHLFDTTDTYLTLDEDQATYIVEMPLYRLTKADSIEALAKLEKLLQRQHELDHLLNSPEARRDVISRELDEVSKIFDDEEYDRRTVINPETKPVPDGANVDDKDRFYQSWKFSADDATIGDSGDPVEEGNSIWAVFDNGKVKRFTGHGIPIAVKPKPLAPVANTVVCGQDNFDNKTLCIVTRGTNKSKTAKLLRIDLGSMKEQSLVANGVSGIKLMEGDEVATAFTVEQGQNVLLASRDSYKVLNLDDIAVRGTNTQGMGVFKLLGDDPGVYEAHVGGEFIVNGAKVQAGNAAKTPKREELETWDKA